MNSKNNKLTQASIGLILLAMIAGCDEPTTQSKSTTKPTAAVATTAAVEPSAVLASYPVRPPAVIDVDGRDVMFPAAKLAVIDRRTGGITLRLCSDDPADAIDPGYIGNSFVMDMRLGIDRLEDIPASTWDYKSSDADDSTSGVFMHGNKEQYRPADVHISFGKTGDDLLVYISGTFSHSDNANPAAPPDRVQVNACLQAPAPVR